jgi:hypothetical protein
VQQIETATKNYTQIEIIFQNIAIHDACSLSFKYAIQAKNFQTKIQIFISVADHDKKINKQQR